MSRATLARQRLLEPADTDPVALIRATGPPQAQHAPSPHLSLRARSARPLAEVTAGLEAALADRSLVKATLMRGTLHLLPSDAYWDVRAALDASLRSMFRQYARWEPDGDATAGLRAALAEAADEPRTRGQIAERLRGRAAEALPDASAVSMAARYLLPAVHAPECGSWDAPRRVRLLSADVWLAEHGNPAAGALGDAEAGRRWLVRAHLGAYGPATVADIATWSRLGIREIRRVVAELSDEVAWLVGPDGTKLVDLADAPSPTGSASAAVALLPWWDALLLAHRDRSRVLGRLPRSAVVRPNGDVLPTVLVDGQVAATWRQESSGDGGCRIVVAPLVPLDDGARAAVAEAAEALARELAPRAPHEVTIDRGEPATGEA